MEAPWRRIMCDFYFSRIAADPGGGGERQLSQNLSVAVSPCDQALPAPPLLFWDIAFSVQRALRGLLVLGHGGPDACPSEIQ